MLCRIGRRTGFAPFSSKPANAKTFVRPAASGSAGAHSVAGFVTSWAGYDNGNLPVRHYDGSRRRLALAGFAASGLSRTSFTA
jgi:hypothetical protein